MRINTNFSWQYCICLAITCSYCIICDQLCGWIMTISALKKPCQGTTVMVCWFRERHFTYSWLVWDAIISFLPDLYYRKWSSSRSQLRKINWLTLPCPISFSKILRDSKNYSSVSLVSSVAHVIISGRQHRPYYLLFTILICVSQLKFLRPLTVSW